MSSRAWLSALAAIAIGAAAGYFVCHPLPLTRTMFEAIYRLSVSVIGGWITTYDRFLLSSAVVSALPTILLLGLVLGLVVSRIRYPRLLMYSILLWPVYFYAFHLIGITLLRRSEKAAGLSGAASGMVADRYALDLDANFFAYSLLFLIILAVRFAARTKSPPGTTARAA